MTGLRGGSRARGRQAGPRPTARRLLAQAATITALFAFSPLLLPLLAVSSVPQASAVAEISPTVRAARTTAKSKLRAGSAQRHPPVNRPTSVLHCVPTPPASLSPCTCQVYIGGIQDLRPDSTGASKCSRLVDAAVSYGHGVFQRAQFLVSVLWWDSGPRDPPSGYTGCQNYTLSSEW